MTLPLKYLQANQLRNGESLNSHESWRLPEHLAPPSWQPTARPRDIWRFIVLTPMDGCSASWISFLCEIHCHLMLGSYTTVTPPSQPARGFPRNIAALPSCKTMSLAQVGSTKKPFLTKGLILNSHK